MVVLPVAADVRRARSTVARGMRPVLQRARGPVLVALGVGGVAWSLSRRFTDPGLDETAGTAGARPAARTPGDLRGRGELAWEQLLARPEATDLISRGALLGANLAQWVEDAADEVHDRSEEILARLGNTFPGRHRE